MMRAAIYESFGGAITVNEVARPSVAAGELVVEVLAVGLCRSDYHGWHGTDPDIVCPLDLEASTLDHLSWVRALDDDAVARLQAWLAAVAAAVA